MTSSPLTPSYSQAWLGSLPMSTHLTIDLALARPEWAQMPAGAEALRVCSPRESLPSAPAFLVRKSMAKFQQCRFCLVLVL